MKLKMVGFCLLLSAFQTVNTSGQITINPLTRVISKEGGGASILTAGSGTWTATTAAEWINITPRTNGVAGESCIYVVSANFSADTRVGVILIGGTNHTVTQNGYDATLTPVEAYYGIAGGTGSIAVATEAGVSWSASTPTSWINLATTNGIASGTVLYSVAPTVGFSPVLETITVASKTFTVTQTGVDVNISPVAVDKTYGSDIIQISVTALAETLWTVIPNNPWITVVDDGNGFGDSVITIAIGTNPSYAPRVGTVCIGSALFTVRQEGVPSANIDITPYFSTASPNGALGNIAVSATPDAPWTAQSQASWILIANGSSGSGNGNINYIAAANPTIYTRTGTIIVNGSSPNFASRDFSRGALHIFSNRVDFARSDISIINGNNYPDFTGTQRATLTGYGIKDTDDWALAFRFRHNSNGEIHRLLYYAEGGRTLAIWVDANRKLNVCSDSETYAIDTVNCSAGTNYFVLAQGTTNSLDVYLSILGSTPVRFLQIARSSSVFPPNANLMNLQLGGSEVPSSGNYIGNMSLLSIHNRQLTAAEIENYRQSDPWNDAASSFASPMFISRDGTNITPTRALLMRGNLRDQMGLGKARLMNGTNQNFRFKTATDRYGEAGSALDNNNGSNYRLALGNNAFRTLTFWFKTSSDANRTIVAMRSTKAGEVLHQCQYYVDYYQITGGCVDQWCTATRTTSGSPDYYRMQLNASGNIQIKVIGLPKVH